jgi:type VII secretion protein EccB
MASRADMLHSYRFVAQRIVSALVVHDPDPPQPPFRGTAAAAMVGVLLAALAVASVGVYAVVSPSGNNWRDPTAVIVDRETGARYLYVDGRLVPVLNYASALLAIGSTRAHVVNVQRTAIADVPRSAPIGIAGAPDSLPTAGRLLGPPWTVCSGPDRSATVVSTVVIGAAVAGGRALDQSSGLLAQGRDGTAYLIWQQRRMRLPDPLVVRALGWNAPPVPVAAAFLSALRPTPDIRFWEPPGLGASSHGFRVGQVLRERAVGGGGAYFLVLREGLAPLTTVQERLLEGDQAETAHVDTVVVDVAPSEIASQPAARLPEGVLPERMPRLQTPLTEASTICAQIPDAGGAARVSIDVPAVAGATVQLPGGGALADRVLIQPGHGALVATASAPGDPATTYLVTDLGWRYPLASTQAQAALGFAGINPMPLPAGVIAMLPAGPALDPDAARTPVTAPR